MRVRDLVLKEIGHRRLSFVLGLLSVVVAVGSFVGAITLLQVHDLRTGQILAQKQAAMKAQLATLQDDVRKAMLKLGFNVVILPKEQDLGDWHADDAGSRFMPEDYVDRLAESGVVTVRHFLPSLQQRIFWPEQKRTIILVGTRGEVPNLHKGQREPMVQPVPDGKMVLGHELSQSLGLGLGDSAVLMGRTYTVHRFAEERGNKDDITVWIPLRDAQELLGKEGRINAILALQCLCAGRGVAKVREDIARVLPNTQVVEMGTRVLARAEARMRVAEDARASLAQEKETRSRLRGEREGLASILTTLVIVACAVWVGFLALSNVRERRSEIGILRALGFRSRQILMLFLSRAVIIGLIGAVLGTAAGLLAGRHVGLALEEGTIEVGWVGSLLDPLQVGLALLMAPLLSIVASWIPAVMAAQHDPAEILREE